MGRILNPTRFLTFIGIVLYVLDYNIKVQGHLKFRAFNFSDQTASIFLWIMLVRSAVFRVIMSFAVIDRILNAEVWTLILQSCTHYLFKLLHISLKWLHNSQVLQSIHVFFKEQVYAEVDVLTFTNQVALSFVFLMRPMPAKKKMPPSTPVKIMVFIFRVLSPPFIKLMPA